jgi:cardiolipin synthase
MNIKNAILYIPNLLSIARIILIPLFIYLLFIPSNTARLWALIVFAIASLTDLLDGWSARKLNQESELGEFLDPLADKFLVLSTIIALLLLDPLISFWMVLIIVGRDVLITLMRYLAIKEGTVLKTSRFGKVKTAFQMGSIVIIIMIYMVRKKGVHIDDAASVFDIMQSSHPEKWFIVAPYWIMFVVTLLTAVSGLRYLVTNRHLFTEYMKKNRVKNED